MTRKTYLFIPLKADLVKFELGISNYNYTSEQFFISLQLRVIASHGSTVFNILFKL